MNLIYFCILGGEKNSSAINYKSGTVFIDVINQKDLFFFVVEFAVAIAFEVFVLNLLTEFLAHTFVFRKFTDLAGTIAVLLAETFLNLFYNRFILVKSYFHNPP